jgi:hypothetical protein
LEGGSIIVILSNQELFNGIFFIESFSDFFPFKNTFFTLSVTNLLKTFTIFCLGFLIIKSTAFLAAYLGEVNRETNVLTLANVFVILVTTFLVFSIISFD